MAKTIKITFYSCRELWERFWTWAFWPRRKKCAEWIEFVQARLESEIISDLLIEKYFNQGILNDAICESLELDIRAIIEKECKVAIYIISKPLYD